MTASESDARPEVRRAAEQALGAVPHQTTLAKYRDPARARSERLTTKAAARVGASLAQLTLTPEPFLPRARVLTNVLF